MRLDEVLDALVPPERAAELKAEWKREEMGLMFQLLSDVRAAEEMRCATCDGPIGIGDRILTTFGRTSHRSCLSTHPEQLAEFRRAKRHTHKPAPAPADPRQASLFEEEPEHG